MHRSNIQINMASPYPGERRIEISFRIFIRFLQTILMMDNYDLILSMLMDMMDMIIIVNQLREDWIRQWNEQRTMSLV